MRHANFRFRLLLISSAEFRFTTWQCIFWGPENWNLLRESMAEYTVSVPLKISDFFPKKLKQQYFIAQMLSKEILNKCDRDNFIKMLIMWKNTLWIYNVGYVIDCTFFGIHLGTRTTVDYFQMLQTSDAVVISNNLRWCPFCISDIIYSRRSVKIFPFQNPAAMMDYFFIRFTFRRICPCHNCFIFLSLL